MQAYFNQVSDLVKSALKPGEEYTASFSAEDSDFVRFNHAQVRQAGTVSQRYVSVELIEGRRHASGTIALSGDLELDRPRLRDLISDLREKRSVLPEDPHFLIATDVHSTERHAENRLPVQQDALGQIRKAGEGRDLVGIYAAGGIHGGFSNSYGQRNWYTDYSYNFDWSFYHEKDKAVKSSYAGTTWDPAAFGRKVDWAGRQIEALRRPGRTIPPGRVRAYFAPAAVDDIIGLLKWGGFGLKAHKTKQTPFLKLITGEVRMNPAVTLLENTQKGIAPNFQEAGFIRPDRVTLIEGGAYKDCLISPRSAKEYGIPTNGASAMESPESVELRPGTIPTDQVLKRLERGIFINNVWYLNYSDRSACRTTGMTRFATFWVEHGEIVAPLNVMRFDETVTRMLGENLIGLTAEQEMILDSSTYGRRSVDSSRVPGVLVEDFTLTL